MWGIWQWSVWRTRLPISNAFVAKRAYSTCLPSCLFSACKQLRMKLDVKFCGSELFLESERVKSKISLLDIFIIIKVQCYIQNNIFAVKFCYIKSFHGNNNYTRRKSAEFPLRISMGREGGGGLNYIQLF